MIVVVIYRLLMSKGKWILIVCSSFASIAVFSKVYISLSCIFFIFS